jgi:uncharacterized protein YkwD
MAVGGTEGRPYVRVMSRYTTRLAALLAALAVLTAWAGPAQASRDEFTQATVHLINAVRDAHGLPAVRLNAQLSTAARRHSKDMVRRHYFSHVTPEGFTFADRIRRTGYLRTNRHWLVGETLAWGWRRRAAPARIVTAWMHSPPHREVILNPTYRDVGIGVVTGVPEPLPRGGATYTADFGVKR